MTRSLLISALLFVSLGCSTVNESRLVGKYSANGSCVNITLVVNADHSFVQTAETRDSATGQLRGAWSIDKKTKTMTFQPFLDFLNDDHGRQLGFTSFTPEMMGMVVEMGPVIVECPDSQHKIDYVK
jgi:hypothetical protein